jgi:hypothetical protein
MTVRFPAAFPALRPLGLAALLAAAPLTSPPPAAADAVDDYVAAALRGDLTGLAERLAALDPAEAAPREIDLARRFRARFVDRNEDLPLPEDPFVAEVVRAYRGYWTRILLGELLPEDAETELLARLAETLDRRQAESDVDAAAPADPAGDDDVLERLDTAIEGAGYGLISGRTLPHLELMLWARQDTTRYDVTLTDERREVTVIFVRDFLVKGWADFATFGRASTGGWATKEALFCLGDDYDLDSEKFRVSYLQHETRHFADYDRFPALEQIDLEYRGKLTELCFAEASLPELLTHFERAGRPDPGAPHSYASFAVIRDLRAELGDAVPPDWEAADRNAVQHAARRLLEKNTLALERAGAAETSGVVAPAPEE